MTPATGRPGYDQIRAASFLAGNAEAWKPFVHDVLGLPLSMLPGVQYAINTKSWKTARDPLQQVRDAATNWAERRALKDADPKAISSERIRSPKTNPLSPAASSSSVSKIRTYVFGSSPRSL
jgi:hypothetical protein